MGEISFKYDAKIKPIQETKFKYLFSDLKKYIIFYQRYAALSNTNILNNPVAITKVATGFYNLYELFIDKTIYKALYTNINKLNKTKSKMFFENQYILRNDLYLNIYNNYNVQEIYNDNLNIINNYNIKKKNNIDINKHKYYNLTTKYIHNNYFKSYYLKEFINNTNINKSYNFKDLYNNNTNLNNDIYLDKINNDKTYLNKIIFNNKPSFKLNISNLFHLKHNYFKLHTFNLSFLKSNNFKLDIFNMLYLKRNHFKLFFNKIINLDSEFLNANIFKNIKINKYDNTKLNISNDFKNFKRPIFKLLKDNSIINNLNKDSYKYIINKYLFFKKYFNNINLFEYYYLNKEKQESNIYNFSKCIIKNKIFFKIFDMNNIIKYNIPLNYIDIIFNDYDNVIIPISKIQQKSYIDKINIMIQKESNTIFLTQNISASVLSKKTNMFVFNTFYDKNKIQTYLDYKNILITKKNIYVNVHKDSFINKNISIIEYYKQGYLSYKDNKNIIEYNNIQTYKDNKNIIEYNNIQTYKDNKNIIEYNTLWTYKDSISIIEYNNIWSYKNKINISNFQKNDIKFNVKLIKKDIEFYNSIFVDKNSQLCYYNYNITWFDKNIYTKINEQLNIKINNTKNTIVNINLPIIRNELNSLYDHIIISKTDIKQSDLCQQIQNIHDINKKLNIQPDDFGNWVWVYEPPDPFEGLKYGIDELLLPENDTRYEDFEDIIFDKKRMIPKNPIKQIDANTFIAKYPIKHPLPKHNNIAVDYEKSAIDIEQFHGIETKIVHEVFLKFYRLWYNKIFEFSTMTMTQSVKLMLEYMYAWIMEYYPLEEIEQALRVLKLIRWYGETSIIQNSQYIVSFEYDTLYSQLNTGECLIPNDLDIDSNDTMYVDKHLSVIRNNPVYIGTTDEIDAYVTFYIDNKVNTSFTFSLVNTVGSVNIYINDNLVDIVSQSTLNLTYELPYIGDTNIVKILKPAAHNLNDKFYIGNIKVPNCSFKELNIEYDPTLKAGNKPLSDIAYKMVAYANIYEDREKIYEILRKSNLGNSEIYKHLLDYWNNHHSYKEKGKRLTIKEI